MWGVDIPTDVESRLVSHADRRKKPKRLYPSNPFRGAQHGITVLQNALKYQPSHRGGRRESSFAKRTALLFESHTLSASPSIRKKIESDPRHKRKGRKLSQRLGLEIDPRIWKRLVVQTKLFPKEIVFGDGYQQPDSPKWPAFQHFALTGLLPFITKVCGIDPNDSRLEVEFAVALEHTGYETKSIFGKAANSISYWHVRNMMKSYFEKERPFQWRREGVAFDFMRVFMDREPIAICGFRPNDIMDCYGGMGQVDAFLHGRHGSPFIYIPNGEFLVEMLTPFPQSTLLKAGGYQTFFDEMYGLEFGAGEQSTSQDSSSDQNRRYYRVSDSRTF